MTDHHRPVPSHECHLGVYYPWNLVNLSKLFVRPCFEGGTLIAVNKTMAIPVFVTSHNT